MEIINCQFFVKSLLEILLLIWKDCKKLIIQIMLNIFLINRSKLEHLPCASLLVRIRSAPLSNDNLRVLGKLDFPNRKDQIRLGIWPPRPLYASTAYNNSLCPIRDSEKELFQLKITRQGKSVRDEAKLLIATAGNSGKMVINIFKIN